MSTALDRYCNCMEEIRHRLGIVASLGEHKISTGTKETDIELAFLQLRKSLEVLAFASLIANKDKYSIAHANFASHWKAKGMLECIEKLNPDFYPVPLELPKLLDTGVKHCDRIADGFITKPEFELLYDKSSEVLHSRNPFTTKDPVIKLVYSTKQWVERIQRLLAFHLVRLVDEKIWMIHIPNEGPVKGYAAEQTAQPQTA
jgi:hypothetical protein